MTILLAYIQSPAGRRFLESTPITLDGESRPTGAPFGRILWSLQAGIVLLALGIGFWFVQNDVMPEIAEGFHILAVIAVALGAGFIDVIICSASPRISCAITTAGRVPSGSRRNRPLRTVALPSGRPRGSM